MNEAYFESEKIWLTIPAGWADITADLEDEELPSTLAKPGGKGALQFSTVLYKSGALPTITTRDLSEMLIAFAAQEGYVQESDMVVSDKEIKFVAANYSHGDDFVRVWYCSDGRNTALVTYLCLLGDLGGEVEESEKIVGTLKFDANN